MRWADWFSVLFVLSVFMTGALNAFICIKSYVLIFLSNWYYPFPLLSFKPEIARRCKYLAAYLLLNALLRNTPDPDASPSSSANFSKTERVILCCLS